MSEHVEEAAASRDPRAPLRTPVILITLVIVVAAMKTAQAILIPLLLAVFFAIIAMGPTRWLCRKGVPNAISVLMVVALVMLIVASMGLLIGSSINDFTARLPEFQLKAAEKLNAVIPRLEIGEDGLRDLIMEQFDPGMAMSLISGMLTKLQGVLANSFLILFTMIFILLEAVTFPDKVRAVMDDSTGTLESMRRFSKNLNRYLAIKTMTSLATGIAVTILVTVLGVDYALLWGLVAFLMNFIPNIGSILAAIPAVLMALLEFDPARALATALGYVIINVVIGTLLEPRIMGRGLGLSTLVVFLSLILWGWVLGPVGMLLSVPLTMTIKIGLEMSESTKRVAILLGSEIPGAAATAKKAA